MEPAPMSSTPQQVADATVRALAGPPQRLGAVGRQGAGVRDAVRTAGAVAQDAPVMNEDAPVITVVGIGADGMAGLGRSDARAELRGATVIWAPAASSICSTTPWPRSAREAVAAGTGPRGPARQRHGVRTWWPAGTRCRTESAPA